jgi:hypothetical protein
MMGDQFMPNHLPPPANRSSARQLLRGGRHHMHGPVNLRSQLLHTVRHGRSRQKREAARERARG